MLTALLALAVAALFTGAAVYVLMVEQPARLALDDHGLLAQWQPSYKRGAVMQAGLALLGSVLGLAAWWQGSDWRWLTGALILLAAWPYTLLIIHPTIKRLQATMPADAGPESRRLIVHWGRLHIGRVAMGVSTTLLFVWACASP